MELCLSFSSRNTNFGKSLWNCSNLKPHFRGIVHFGFCVSLERGIGSTSTWSTNVPTSNHISKVISYMGHVHKASRLLYGLKSVDVVYKLPLTSTPMQRRTILVHRNSSPQTNTMGLWGLSALKSGIGSTPTRCNKIRSHATFTRYFLLWVLRVRPHGFALMIHCILLPLSFYLLGYTVWKTFSCAVNMNWNSKKHQIKNCNLEYTTSATLS